jgi:ABC-2 type transport system ATP-binding protein
VAGYSGGMRRRLDLAAGVVASPEVIFLDEPTTGLDPRARQSMWDVVTRLADAGVTVLLTTQYLDEAERLAGTIAVLDRGRIVAEGTARELKQRAGGARLELTMSDAPSFEALLDCLGVRALSADRSTLTIATPTDGSAADARALLDELDPDGTRVARFEIRTASLDDVFLTLTKDRTHADTPESELANV